MMPTAYDPDTLARRGRALYDRDIRDKVEDAERGKYLVLDVETGDFELDQDHLTASDRMAARHPGKPLFSVRVGYPTLGRIGYRARGSSR
jgi:hypothetical protein